MFRGQMSFGGVQMCLLRPGLSLHQDSPETPRIKEEPEEQVVKQEDEQLQVSVPDFITVCVKDEETEVEDIGSETEDYSNRTSDSDAEADWRHPLSFSDQDASGAEGKKHQCSVCRKRFRSKYDLEMHNRVHTGERPYSCSMCGKAFTQKTILRQHVKIHTGDGATGRAEGYKPQCHICEKAFSNVRSLQSHIRVHTGEKPFSCSYCTKTFSNGSNLKKHMYTHTGEKPYSCSQCTKAFSNWSNLRKHMHIHTGERPFSCSLCLKTFNQNAHLHLHLKTHAAEKPPSCRSPQSAEREESLCGFEEEDQRDQRDQRNQLLLNSAPSPMDQIPSLSLEPGLSQENPETLHLTVELEEQRVKQEEEPLPVSVSDYITVCVKEEELQDDSLGSES